MFLIVTKKNWHYCNFLKLKSKKFILINDKKKFTYKNLKKINPKLIFFPHWSWKVPKKIIANFKCICFHETKLPYGRGGSPIQNLILRNKRNTKICAIEMNDIIDSGNIILSKKLSLEGSAQSIFERSSKIIFEMIRLISKKNKIRSQPQRGKIVQFSRLKNNSELNYKVNSLNQLYNHIRMLDADTYKKVYIVKNNIKIQISNATKTKNSIIASVKINLI